jgi:tRNA(Arg) A34 adenosine deaminase TadA
MSVSQLSAVQDDVFLNRCVALARQALAQQLLPVGAILVDPSGRILAESARQPAALDHAELVVLRDGEGWLRQHPYQATLYSSLEPCLMCLGAALNAKIATLVFATRDGARHYTDILSATPFLRYKATKLCVRGEPSAQPRAHARALLAQYWYTMGERAKAVAFEENGTLQHW